MTSDNSDATLPFIHLHLHSEYALEDGIVRVRPLVDRVKALGMPAVAITDPMNVFAMVKFYRYALSKGIKPIIGADLHVARSTTTTALHMGRSRTTAVPSVGPSATTGALHVGHSSTTVAGIAATTTATMETSYYHITVLCQNQTGYRQLSQLLSRAYLEGQVAGRPVVQEDWLWAHHEGLIVLSGAEQGDVGQALLAQRHEQADAMAQRWQQIFGDRYYIELQRTGHPNQAEYIQSAAALAARRGIPVVATQNVRFLHACDFEAHEARFCIHGGYVLADSRRPRPYRVEQYLTSTEDMNALFADCPAVIENTYHIATRCNLTLTLNQPVLPQFPAPNGLSVEAYLQQQAQEGLMARLEQPPEALTPYQERLKRELDVIIQMGFAGYFLVVADFIEWAKANDIPVGPGRGSGAGSLVAYCLGITELDPLTHELLFERFLNPERVSMPDFDIDFCMDGRDRVIQYVAERYGREAVSQIITYGTMAARAVVRDVGRVLGFPYGFVDKIAKLVPFELGMTLEKALQQEDQLAARYQAEEDVSTLIDLAKSLEGVPRNAGKHAGGVVIAPTQLTDFTPLYCEPDGTHAVTQFDKDDVEAIGLVKFDFLGLRTLTIIHWALVAVNQRRQQQGEPPIVLTDIPLQDAATFALLQRCETTAVFQLESRGMKDLIRRLVPDSFDDMTALVALFRPGPLQSGMVDDFIDRKHGRAPVTYLHPELAPILKPTYGVILYQEQVMQIAQRLAGYTLGGADILRRAMGKKKPEEMAKQRKVFLDGASANGIDSNLATKIFDLMEKFAGYGFNKSHSAAYALIAYQTAWLKAHYPAEFMAAVLSSDMDNTDKVVNFINECRRMQLTVCPPDINQSDYPFVVNETGEIAYGLGAIKGVGKAIVELIVAERNRHGPYTDLFDCCRRVDPRKLNRRALEPLIASGAMDALGKSRAGLMAQIDLAFKAAEQSAKDRSMGQASLFGAMSTLAPVTPPSVSVTPWSTRQRLHAEYNCLGHYLSGHPLTCYEQEFTDLSRQTIEILQQKASNRSVTVLALIAAVKVLHTKQGHKMAALTLEDRSGRIEATVFQRSYPELRDKLQVGFVVIVKGQTQADVMTGGQRLIVDQLNTVDAVRQQFAKYVQLTLSNDWLATHLVDLKTLLQGAERGYCPVKIQYQQPAGQVGLTLGSEWNVAINDHLLETLRDLCGGAQVNVHYGVF